MPVAFVGFGGNVGDVPGTYSQVLQQVRHWPTSTAVVSSSLYRTAPIGEAAGDPFWNAVFQIETNAAPIELLDQLQSLERSFGRTRSVFWGPRTIDLDLLAFGQTILDSSRLQLPHPSAWYRRFVLDPWQELAPDYVHPVCACPLSALARQLARAPLAVGWRDDEASRAAGWQQRLAAEFSGLIELRSLQSHDPPFALPVILDAREPVSSLSTAGEAGESFPRGFQSWRSTREIVLARFPTDRLRIAGDVMRSILDRPERIGPPVSGQV